MMMSQVSLPIKVTEAKWNWRWYCSFIPKIFVVATWSPKLNKKGNSELGMHALNY
jgi:hypothetical protein